MEEGLVISDVRMQYERRRDRRRTRQSADESRVAALESVSLSIRPGSFVSIVGPSGCGKSTLLLIIDGLVQATSGTVTVNGLEVSGPGRDRAMVFQEASLLPWFSTLRNCAYGLECQGVPRKEAERAAAPLLALVGLKGFEKHYPSELSVGMQQRANLARAIATDPSVLLMDEPFAALDAQTRELMQAELLRIWAEARKTVVFVTHQLDEAIYLSDRVVVMSRGPGRILDDVEVDLPRPRPLEVKRSPAFLQLEERLWRTLQGQVRFGEQPSPERVP